MLSDMQLRQLKQQQQQQIIQQQQDLNRLNQLRTQNDRDNLASKQKEKSLAQQPKAPQQQPAQQGQPIEGEQTAVKQQIADPGTQQVLQQQQQQPLQPQQQCPVPTNPTGLPTSCAIPVVNRLATENEDLREQKRPRTDRFRN